MKWIFLAWFVFVFGCEEFEDDFFNQKTEIPEFSECEEGESRCDEEKFFVYRCDDGWWERYTDCDEMEMVCFLYEGVASCREKGETPGGPM